MIYTKKDRMTEHACILDFSVHFLKVNKYIFKYKNHKILISLKKARRLSKKTIAEQGHTLIKSLLRWSNSKQILHRYYRDFSNDKGLRQKYL